MDPPPGEDDEAAYEDPYLYPCENNKNFTNYNNQDENVNDSQMGANNYNQPLYQSNQILKRPQLYKYFPHVKINQNRHNVPPQSVSMDMMDTSPPTLPPTTNDAISSTPSTVADLPSTEVQTLFLEKSNLQPLENSELFHWRGEGGEDGGGGGGGGNQFKVKTKQHKDQPNLMTPSMIKDLPSTSSVVVLHLEQKELKPIEKDDVFMYVRANGSSPTVPESIQQQQPIMLTQANWRQPTSPPPPPPTPAATKAQQPSITPGGKTKKASKVKQISIQMKCKTKQTDMSLSPKNDISCRSPSPTRKVFNSKAGGQHASPNDPILSRQTASPKMFRDQNIMNDQGSTANKTTINNSNNIVINNNQQLQPQSPRQQQQPTQQQQQQQQQQQVKNNNSNYNKTINRNNPTTKVKISNNPQTPKGKNVKQRTAAAAAATSTAGQSEAVQVTGKNKIQTQRKNIKPKSMVKATMTTTVSAAITPTKKNVIVGKSKMNTKKKQTGMNTKLNTSGNVVNNPRLKTIVKQQTTTTTTNTKRTIEKAPHHHLTSKLFQPPPKE